MKLAGRFDRLENKKHKIVDLWGTLLFRFDLQPPSCAWPLFWKDNPRDFDACLMSTPCMRILKGRLNIIHFCTWVNIRN